MKREKFFKRYVVEFLQNSIIEGKRILIVGGNIKEDAARFKPSHCIELFGNGDASFEPAGAGVDNVVYLKKDLIDFESDKPFDYIIFCESLNYEGDLYAIFGKLKNLMHQDSKVFIVEINPYVLFTLKVLNKLGLLTPKLERNMLSLGALENLINIFGLTSWTRDTGLLFRLGCSG